MIVYLLLLSTLLIAAVSLILLLTASFSKGKGNWPIILLAVSVALFIYLFGPWVFLSVYLKYAFALGTLVILTIKLLKTGVVPVNVKPAGRRLASLVGSFFLLLLSALYFTGTVFQRYDSIDLALPFKQGQYFVFQGGRGLPTNVFHFFGRRTLFAMDIIKLNKLGNRANQIFSTELNDYAIFGDTIYSPCNGIVEKAEDRNPDNIPPARKRGTYNLNGVIVKTPQAYVLLGHMEQGKVFVKEGDTVGVGQPLGLAGNSGMSLEPHLHIQAHANIHNGKPWYQQPQLAITFNHKSYNLFQIIEAGNSNFR